MMQDSYAHCEQLVKESDKDRYLATLFVRAEKRPHVFALYAFNAEIAQARDRIHQPLAGEIRLQWWRDALSGTPAGDVSRNPVAAALNETIERYGLPHAAFEASVDARQFDLYDEPMPSLAALESYLRATASVQFGLVARLLAGTETAIANAAHFAGLAYGIAGLLRAFPLHASRGQVYLPAEVLERHGANPAEVVSGRASPALKAALADMRGHARRHLTEARAQLGAVPKSALAAFLPLALVDPYLARMERPDYEPFKTPVEVPQWRRQWALWRASWRGI